MEIKLKWKQILLTVAGLTVALAGCSGDSNSTVITPKGAFQPCCSGGRGGFSAFILKHSEKAVENKLSG